MFASRTTLVHNGVMASKEKRVRQSVTLPAKVATQVRSMAKRRRLSANRMLVELVEEGIVAQKERKRLFSNSRNAFGPRRTPKKSSGWAKNSGRWFSVGRCPGLNNGANFPKKLRQHLIQRMADRSITIEDLNQLRLWGGLQPRSSPRANGTKRSFKVCGEGPYPKTFLLPGQTTRGVRL
jgi:hypothetical protein